LGFFVDTAIYVHKFNIKNKKIIVTQFEVQIRVKSIWYHFVSIIYFFTYK